MIFKGETIKAGRHLETPSVVKWGTLAPGTFGESYIVTMSVADPKLANKMWKKLKKMAEKYDAKHFEATTTEEVEVVVTE